MRYFTTSFIIFTTSLMTACGNNDAPSSETAGVETRAEIESRVDATSDNKIASQMVSKMSALADTLETVTDENSARKAAKDIAVIGAELEALATKADNSDSMNKMSLMMQANSQEFMNIQTKLASNMARIALTDPKLLEIIGEEMEKLDLQ